MVVAIAIVVAVAGLGVLIVMLISLTRQTLRLAGAMAEFEQAVRPVMDEIRADADRAQSRMGRLSERRPQRSATTMGRR